MGQFYSQKHHVFLETDDYQDGYSNVRALEAYERSLKAQSENPYNEEWRNNWKKQFAIWREQLKNMPQNHKNPEKATIIEISEDTIRRILDILPIKPGDEYYTIEMRYKIDYEVSCTKDGDPHLVENRINTGKIIEKHKWTSLSDIIKAIENERIHRNIFLTYGEAEKSLPSYWEESWGKLDK